MKVSDLRKQLEQYPDDMEVIVECFSDYTEVESNHIGVINAVKSPDYVWIMKSHPTMSKENKNNEKSFLLISSTPIYLGG